MTAKVLMGVSLVCLSLSVVFGVLNVGKTQSLRAELLRSDSARMAAERRSAAREKEMRGRPASAVESTRKPDDQSKVAAAEAELVKTQREKEELLTKRRANEAEIAELRKRAQEAGAASIAPGASPASHAADLEKQLDDARKQLDAAEREKTLLADKIRSSQERATQLESEKKRRIATTGSPGVRGTVLAVNQVYNFVVLNLGGRHGLEANAEMLVVRGGSVIGKIRISSVEPATAIGDIITSSLARGVQVEPGDTVIYAGSNS